MQIVNNNTSTHRHTLTIAAHVKAKIAPLNVNNIIQQINTLNGK